VRLIMEKKLKNLLKALKINETTISTLMGGVVVVIVAVLMFNYFKSIDNDKGTLTDPVKIIEVTEGEKPDHLPDTYIVEKGDHLWSIAERFYKSGYNFVDIAEANLITDPGLIEVGQELVIPQVAVRKITVEDTTLVNTIESDSYTTVAGDYLWDIAVRAYGDGFAWVSIYQANKELIGPNPSMLYKGITLSLPR
jgi:nucleoid-associated protein YgaU